MDILFVINAMDSVIIALTHGHRRNGNIRKSYKKECSTVDKDRLTTQRDENANTVPP